MTAMTDGVHRLALRVYYEDTDAGGIVYHTAYLRFAERGRTEYLRATGFDHQNLRRETGAGFVVRHIAVDYRRAAYLDDELVVTTRVVETSGASARMDQQVLRDGVPLVSLSVQLAFLGDDGRPKRLPGDLRQAFLSQT
jgi:acyl-CoA thioester hydrolase